MPRTQFSATDLKQLRHQLDRWRQCQSGTIRLPQALWTSAATLALTHGVGTDKVTGSLSVRLRHSRSGASATGLRSPSRIQSPDVNAKDEPSHEPWFRSRGRESAPSRSVKSRNQRRLTSAATNRFMVPVRIRPLNVNASPGPNARRRGIERPSLWTFLWRARHRAAHRSPSRSRR